MLWNHHHHQAAAKRGSLGSKIPREYVAQCIRSIQCMCNLLLKPTYVNTATTHTYIWCRQCSVSKCIGIQHVVVAPGALVTGHMANPHPFLPHHSRPGVGPTKEIVSFPDCIFRLPEKWLWWTAYSIFIQVRRNVGALSFSNLMLDIIEDCIPRCVWTIY